MTNIERFKFFIESALSILEAERGNVKIGYDSIQREYENKEKDKNWAEATEGFAESGVMLEQMISELKKCLEFNF